MQPDPSVEARPLYSTASALRFEGAPECNDFEWLSLTLMPQDSLPKPLIFHLSNLTDFQVQSETLRIPREGACPETLKNNSLVEECENRCTSHAPGLGLLLVVTEFLGGFYWEPDKYQNGKCGFPPTVFYLEMLGNTVKTWTFPFSPALKSVMPLETFRRRTNNDFLPRIHRRKACYRFDWFWFHNLRPKQTRHIYISINVRHIFLTSNIESTTGDEWRCFWISMQLAETTHVQTRGPLRRPNRVFKKICRLHFFGSENMGWKQTL